MVYLAGYWFLFQTTLCYTTSPLLRYWDIYCSLFHGRFAGISSLPIAHQELLEVMWCWIENILYLELAFLVMGHAVCVWCYSVDFSPIKVYFFLLCCIILWKNIQYSVCVQFMYVWLVHILCTAEHTKSWYSTVTVSLPLPCGTVPLSYTLFRPLLWRL